jgi:short-subunit dehydrogenase
LTAFLLSYTESLHEELQSSGVKVSCICPGPIDTDFFINSGQKALTTHKRSMVDPQFVADAMFELMFQPNRASLIPDWANTLTIFFITTFFSRSFVTRLAGRMSQADADSNENNA